MQTKLIILLLVLLGVSSCEMEKKFQEFDLEELTVLNHQVYSQLFETSKEKYFFRAYHYKRTPDSVETLYPEEVYLATMKIMDSYGVDTNKFDRKTIAISIINDSLKEGNGYQTLSISNEIPSGMIPDPVNILLPPKKPIELRIADLKTFPNLALVKKRDYEKYLAPITPYIYKKETELYYFVRFNLSQIDFNESEGSATFEYFDSGGVFLGSGEKLQIQKFDDKWYITNSLAYKGS